MDTIVWILIFLAVFNFLLKLTFWKWRAAVIAAAVSALFVLWALEFAIEQSKTQIADWLANPALMLDTSVILTVEVALQMAFCLLAVHVENVSPVQKRMKVTFRLLYWFPGLLIFAVFFFALTQLIFALPGIPFKTVAWGFAGFIFVVLPLGQKILYYLLPEKELRLELLFLTNALVAVLGIIATVNGKTAVEGVAKIDWLAFGGCIAICVLGGMMGIIYENLKKK